MLVKGLLLAATAAAVPAPPVPPAPPAPFAAAPTPPLPPLPPVDVDMWGGGRQTVISRNIDGHRVTVIARSPGGKSRPAALTYRDAEGRDVQVYSDRPVSREEADRLLAEGKAQGERARAEGARAREQGRLAREAGERARVEGEHARVDAERIRREAMESARRAVEAAGLSARDYADLGNMRSLRIFRDGGPVVDGGRPGPGFAEGPQVRALRDEVRALREELRAMRAELERGHARR